MARRHLRCVRLLRAADARTCAIEARFTGYHRDGGYAEYTVAKSAFALRCQPAAATSKRRRSCVRA